MKSYLQALNAANNNIANPALGDFLTWCENDLIVSKEFQGTEPAERSCCGLSIYIPSIGDANNCYDSLPLYQQTRLSDVIKPVARDN